MGEFVKGDVVVLPFPFSDLSTSKRRPALVIAQASKKDLILAQITSQAFYDSCAVKITPRDFVSGGLQVPSNIRANKLFTAESDIIIYKTGRLSFDKTNEAISVIVNLLQEGV